MWSVFVGAIAPPLSGYLVCGGEIGGGLIGEAVFGETSNVTER